MEALANQLGHCPHGQWPQVQRGASHRCGYGQRCAGGGRIVALGDNQQQVSRHVSQQLGQQLPGGVVGPLQVVEEQHQRLARPAENLQEFNDRVQFLVQRKARGLGG